MRIWLVALAATACHAGTTTTTHAAARIANRIGRSLEDINADHDTAIAAAAD